MSKIKSFFVIGLLGAQETPLRLCGETFHFQLA